MTIKLKQTLLGAAIAMVLAAGASHALADEIRVLNWKGYGSDADWAVTAFAEKTGHTVVHDYFNSEEEMLTKLRTNPGTYDVVMINAAFTAKARREGLIGEIDVSDISSYGDLSPNMAKNAELAPDGVVYGVPWVWGVTSFAVNSNEVNPVPTSINIFWDTTYKGKIGWRDEPNLSVFMGALATGQSINDIKDLEAVKAKLTELMPQIATFWGSENDWNQFFSAGEFWIATYWSGSAGRSASKGLPLTYVIAEEGAVGWLDSFSIPSSSKHPEAARAFIDWMIDPEFYLKWAAEGAPVSANAVASAALPEDNFNKKTLGDPNVVARVQFQQPLLDETKKAYLQLWQEVKANAQ